jgi:hypothetical protein
VYRAKYYKNGKVFSVVQYTSHEIMKLVLNHASNSETFKLRAIDAKGCEIWESRKNPSVYVVCEPIKG